MAGNVTFMEVPPNINDPLVLRRFLLHLIEKIDRSFGNRGDEGFVGASQAAGISSSIATTTFQGQIFTNVKRYSDEFNLLNDRDLIDRGFLLDNSTKNDEQSAISDISYTKAVPSAGYVQAEAVIVDNGVDANTNKINSILTALRSADIIEV